MWINTPEQSVYNKVGSEAIIRIKKAYDANDIMIPFPIRTLDFGIKRYNLNRNAHTDGNED
jgi:small-conductance mechanosensitive channel